MLHIAGVNYESMVDGVGTRAVIYISGCSHHCPGCQNPETWDASFGQPLTEALVREIADGIRQRMGFLAGITLTGGDPFFSPKETFMFLCDLLEELGWRYAPDNVPLWIYTGYTLEELVNSGREDQEWIDDLLENAQALVDGPYIASLADKTLLYRGSSNQRVWTKDEIKMKMEEKHSHG